MIDYRIYIITLICALCSSCHSADKPPPTPYYAGVEESIIYVAQEWERIRLRTADDIHLSKQLAYDQYTLDDVYPYRDTTRSFQFDKVKERLAIIENMNREDSVRWAVLQNYKNRNGEATLVKKFSRDAYKRVVDTLGQSRYQSVPLYLLNDTVTPEIYGKDGEPVRFLGQVGTFAQISPVDTKGVWLTPMRYIKQLPDTIQHFSKAVVVDRKNQNISTYQQSSPCLWTITSMNPATTGKFSPPYSQLTPIGIFVAQDKKAKMLFLKDGSSAIGGFAPWATRFTNGAYVHGVPSNVPQTATLEYSSTLGTIPRSHMCVRNATSHAKFIYDWAPVNEAIIFVLE